MATGVGITVMMPGAPCNAEVSLPMESSRGVGMYSSPPPLFLPRPRCNGVRVVRDHCLGTGDRRAARHRQWRAVTARGSGVSDTRRHPPSAAGPAPLQSAYYHTGRRHPAAPLSAALPGGARCGPHRPVPGHPQPRRSLPPPRPVRQRRHGMQPSSAWGCKTSPSSITRSVVRHPNVSRPRSGKYGSEQCWLGKALGRQIQESTSRGMDLV
jgi:hypothetical protein